MHNFPLKAFLIGKLYCVVENIIGNMIDVAKKPPF